LRDLVVVLKLRAENSSRECHERGWQKEESTVRSSKTRKTAISAVDLEGLPGLRRAAVDRILARQPQTVAELIALRDVGRATARALLNAGVHHRPGRHLAPWHRRAPAIGQDDIRLWRAR